jgi:signal transduction histidine kinase
MPWPEGPCAVVLVERAWPPERGDAILVWGAAVVAAGLLLAILAAAGPIVRRVRRLTEEVGRSAESRYRRPVEASGSDEVAGLAAAFNAAGAEVRAHLEKVESRERTLRDFVANTTHDVMIPLTVLQGHLARLRTLAERSGGGDPETVRAAIEEAHYLGCLVQNLSAAAKLASDEVHLDLRPVDLGAIVERVAARHRPVAQAAGVAIEHAVPPEPVRVTGDETLLEQAVSNAVHNAVRYNRAGGHVAIVLEASRAGEPTFLLRVIDDGPGIPEAEMSRVLERGYRTKEARTRAPDGAGLGLHIAEEVTARHGFALALARSEHGGLEVRFSGRKVCATDRS